MFFAQLCDVENAALRSDEPIRREQGQHDIRRSRRGGEVGTDGGGVRRVFRKPGEEIQMDDCRGKQVHRIHAVAVTVNFQGIGLGNKC